MQFLKTKRINPIFCIIFVTVALLFLTPVHADKLILEEYSDPLLQVKTAQKLLENGTGILLATGDSWKFYQGYVVSVKSVNLDQKQAWIKLENKNETVKERILSEGDIFVYMKDDGAEILNMTVDTIYISPEGELVAFKPVYQYLDYDLPEPIIPDEEETIISNNESRSSSNNGNTERTSGFTILQSFACTSILLACRKVFEK